MIDGQSLNLTHERIAALKALMPDVFSEDRIDIDRLRQTLGEEVFVKNEHYELSWAGKSDARREIQRQTTATLVPDRSASVDFDASDNVFIEGENLEVLRVLQRAYFGRVKMIYIDPPYNTGSDSFIYPDDYAERLDEYRQRTGKADDDGYINKQDLWHQNRRESGQFHSAWMSMMYPRLFMARNLLREDGVIFVSIDDNEVTNLRAMLDEVFGEENFVGTLVWQKSKKGDAKLIARTHEYILVAAKSVQSLIDNGIWRKKKPGVDEVLQQYETFKGIYKADHQLIATAMRQWYSSLPKIDSRRNHEHYRWSDERGLYFADNFAGPDDGRESRPRYDIIHPVTGNPCKKPSTGWRWDEKKTKEALQEYPIRIHFGPDENTVPCRKSYLFEIDSEPLASVFYKDGRAGTLAVENLLGSGIFDFPKDIPTLSELIKIITDPTKVSKGKKPKTLSKNLDKPIILDFFAGSATTAQAVMELNAEDGGNRSFVLVQLPEPTDPKSEAYRAGYKTIADISRERIRRVIQKMQREADETAHAIATLDTTIIDKVAQIAEIRATTPIELFDATNPPKAIQRLTVELDKLEKKRSEIRDSHDRLAQTAKNFRAYRLSPSNFNVWQNNTTDPRDIEQLLIDFAQSDKPGAEAERMLTEFLLKTGYPLTTSVEVLDLGGVPAYSVEGGELLILLDGYNEVINAQIWATHPKHVVCLDRLFAGRDEVLANLNLELADRDIKLTVI